MGLTSLPEMKSMKSSLNNKPDNPKTFTGSLSRKGKKYAFYAIGVIISLLLWWVFTYLGNESLNRFSPSKTIEGFGKLLTQIRFWEGLWETMKRLIGSLALATLLGIPVGILIGFSTVAGKVTYVPFQFLRMISPLSWTPVAIILFGIGSGPVYFLLTIAAIWPIILNTAAGVHAADAKWIEFAKTQGAKNWQIVIYIVFPSSLPHILTGLQLALGVAWIVLVPAEMLGVSSGLGYMILDFRDIGEYGSIMSVIIVIGLLGLLTDLPIRYGVKKTAWNN